MAYILCLILLVRVVDVHVESCIVLITSVFVFSLDFPVLPWFSVSIGSCYAAVALTKWDGHQLRQKELLLASSDVYITYTPTPLVAGKFPKGRVALLYLHWAIPCFILFYFFKVVDDQLVLIIVFLNFFWCRGHHNGPNTVSSSNITNPMMMNAPNNHHVLTPVPGDPSGRLVMTLLPSQGTHHDLMHGQHDPNIHHHSGASHTSSSHSTRYNHPGWCISLDCVVNFSVYRYSILLF